MGMKAEHTGINIHVLENRGLVYIVDGTEVLFVEEVGRTLTGEYLVMDQNRELLVSRYVFHSRKEAMKRVMDNWFVLHRRHK